MHANGRPVEDVKETRQVKRSVTATPEFVVVMRLGAVYRAELADESPLGIGFLVNSMVPSLESPGQTVEVVYRGRRQTAVIRHVTRTDQGLRIGVEWQTPQPTVGVAVEPSQAQSQAAPA